MDWAGMAKRIDVVAQAQAAVRLAIDRHVTPDCYDTVDGVVCRNKNYAKLVFRLIGGSFRYIKSPQTGEPLIVKNEYEDGEGKYYTWTSYGEYELPNGDLLECSGLFSSRDKFFGKIPKAQGGGFKDASEVDERNVRQAAMTECFKKGVLGALGYSDLSADEAAKAGIKTDAKRSFNHNAGSKGGDTDTPEQRSDRGAIERLCIDLLGAGFHVGSMKFNQPVEILKALTASNDPKSNWKGWNNFGFIKVDQLGRIRAHLEKTYETFTGQSWDGDTPPSDDQNGGDQQ
jgi:hypothetical protein